MSLRAVGLITEYNPFHNGHRYHVDQARSRSGAEVVVAVMSGHFLQRGEPALVDKWARAAMALQCGVDVVIELPFPFACNSAPLFAHGGVEMLSCFGSSLDTLCFGSESGELSDLQQMAEAFEQVSSLTAGSDHARRGLTFPEARSQILAAQGIDIPGQDQPNNILGVAYLRALQQQRGRLEPLTIARRGAQYHDRQAGDGIIASATAVRCLLDEGQDVDRYLPAAAAAVLKEKLSSGLSVDPQRWFNMVQQACLGGVLDDASVYQFEPGFAERIYQAALTAGDYASLVDSIKARHLTRTRVQRLLCYIVTGMSATLVDSLIQYGTPYLQLLGATRRGERYLAQCRKSMTRPLVSNFSRIRPQLKRFYADDSTALSIARQLLDCEDRATRLYSLLLPGWQERSRQWNYIQDPLRF